MKYRVFDGSQKTKPVSARRVVRLYENGRISHDAKVIDENGKSITVAKFVSMVQDRMAGQIAESPRDVPEPVVDTTDHVAFQNAEETLEDDYKSDVSGQSALDDDDQLFGDDVGDFADSFYPEGDDTLASSWLEPEYPIVKRVSPPLEPEVRKIGRQPNYRGIIAITFVAGLASVATWFVTSPSKPPIENTERGNIVVAPDNERPAGLAERQIDYLSEMRRLNKKMASETEEIYAVCHEIAQRWHGAIFEKKTDFNLAIAAYLLEIEDETRKRKSTAEEIKADLASLAQATGTDRELYRDLTEVYGIYIDFLESAISPQGNYRTYTDETKEQRSDILRRLSSLDVMLGPQLEKNIVEPKDLPVPKLKPELEQVQKPVPERGIPKTLGAWARIEELDEFDDQVVGVRYGTVCKTVKAGVDEFSKDDNDDAEISLFLKYVSGELNFEFAMVNAPQLKGPMTASNKYLPIGATLEVRHSGKDYGPLPIRTMGGVTWNPIDHNRLIKLLSPMNGTAKFLIKTTSCTNQDESRIKSWQYLFAAEMEGFEEAVQALLKWNQENGR